VSEKEARAKAFTAMKRMSVKHRPKPKARKYRTAGSDKKAGLLNTRRGTVIDAIMKANG